MKHFILLLALALPFQIQASSDCVLKNEIREQKHFICQTAGTTKAIHVLDLQGGFAETAYYHGYFLKSEIEAGPLKGVQIRSKKAFSELDKKSYDQLQLLKQCVIDNYRHSVSEEFKSGLVNLYRGMKDAGSSITWTNFEETNYMVEFSIFADAIQKIKGENPGKATLKALGSCGHYFVGNALLKPFQKLAQGLKSIKMGCTGITASARSSKDGALIHGRNFDTGLLSFYEPQQVIVINRQKNGITSVGIASPGLHYAGGISGFNNQGISVSLHELQTVGAKIRYERNSSDIAPYLLHSVLMRARTLNEAIRIIQDRKGFGAWTFLISDSKTDETASIELSGNTVVVARRSQNRFLGQSNHFIGPATTMEGYEYSLNKTLETRARLKHVERTLAQDFGKIDAQWVINGLSGHFDELVGPRSFGRTTTKTYTAATHVMIPARQEWWMSVGETYPTNRSHFIGFHLLGPDSPVPVEIIGITKAWEDPSKTAWYDSMKFYVLAYLSNEDDHKTMSGLDRTLGLLEQASNTASLSGIYEFPYEFMQARIKILRAARAIMSGHKDIAYEDLLSGQQRLTEISHRLGSRLHLYEKFQVDLWYVRAEMLKPQAHQNRLLQQSYQFEARNMLKTLIAQYPQQSELYDLKWSLDEKAQLYIVLDAEIRFGTVE